MRKSLYFRLFLMFFATLFVSLSLIAGSFLTFRQRAESENFMTNLLDQARIIAEYTNDYQRLRMDQSVYRKLLDEHCGQTTSIWVVNDFGMILNVSGTEADVQEMTPDAISDIMADVMKGREITRLNAFGDIGQTQVITVAVPVYSDIGHVSGGVYIHRQMNPVRFNTIDSVVLMSAIASLLLSALPMMFVVHSITNPMSEMARASEKYAKGDFTKRIGHSNISEIDMLAQSLNKMAEDLAKLDQLRVGFVANVSHELKSPLTCMQGYVQAMLDGTIAHEDMPKYLEVVQDETRRLTRLVSDLLDLSKMEAGNMPVNKSRFDICELIRRVIIKFETRIDDKKLDVDVIFNPEQCSVFADPDRIEQVISNLIDNAIKFLEEGGTLSVYTTKGADNVLITVKDNGAGISSDDLPFIFERFYKADKAHTSGKGTGLGLSIAQKIIENHGSRITCRSALGEGTEFTFALPLYTDENMNGDNK